MVETIVVEKYIADELCWSENCLCLPVGVFVVSSLHVMGIFCD